MTCFVLVMGMFCAFNLKTDVKIVYNPNQEGGRLEKYTLEAQNMNQTVGEILESNNIDTTEYTVNQKMDEPINNVDEIELKKMASGKIMVDGSAVIYQSGKETVGELLEEYGITLGADDEVRPSADTPLTVDLTEIDVDRVQYAEETGEVEIPFETQVNEDRTLPAATVEVLTPGVNGKKEVKERVKYVNGQRTGSEVLSETVTAQPVAQVTRQNSVGIATDGHQTYQVSDSDFDLICAIVQHEGGAVYDSALAVMSCVLNRADAGNWGGGKNPAAILTAPGQFESYFGGYYAQFLGNSADCVKQAVRECLNGKRNHDFLSFRGYETTGSIQIGGGNYFFNETH